MTRPPVLKEVSGDKLGAFRYVLDTGTTNIKFCFYATVILFMKNFSRKKNKSRLLRISQDTGEIRAF